MLAYLRVAELYPALLALHLPLFFSGSMTIGLVINILIKRYKLFWCRELTLFTIFVLLVTLGVATSTWRYSSFIFWKDVFLKLVVMTYVVTWLIRTPKDFEVASRVLVLGGLLVSSVVIYNWLNHIDLIESGRVTISNSGLGIFEDPNDLALALLLPASLALSYVFNKSDFSKTRILYLLLSPVILGAILTTKSRGGLLGLLSVIGYFLYRKSSSKLAWIPIFILIAAVLYALSGIGERTLLVQQQDVLFDASGMGRIHAWGTAFNMAIHHPLSGVGLSNFVNSYSFYTDYWDNT